MRLELEKPETFDKFKGLVSSIFSELEYLDSINSYTSFYHKEKVILIKSHGKRKFTYIVIFDNPHIRGFSSNGYNPQILKSGKWIDIFEVTHIVLTQLIFEEQ